MEDLEFIERDGGFNNLFVSKVKLENDEYIHCEIKILENGLWKTYEVTGLNFWQSVRDNKDLIENNGRPSFPRNTQVTIYV